MISESLKSNTTLTFLDLQGDEMDNEKKFMKKMMNVRVMNRKHYWRFNEGSSQKCMGIQKSRFVSLSITFSIIPLFFF